MKALLALGVATAALTFTQEVFTSKAMAQCPPVTVLAGASTSGNARCPMLRYRFARSVYLVRAAELAAAGFTAGSMPTSIGWSYQTANGFTGSAPLIVYMENTSDTTNTKSNTWATAITGMTEVHNAVTELPAAVGPFDITLTGAPPFTYTGDGLYIAFDWGQYTGTLSTSVAFCNTALVGGLRGAQSTTATPPTTLAPSDFRPVTRLGGAITPANDAAVALIYALGEVPGCIVPPQIISARVTNMGSADLTNLPVTLTVTGANPFTDTQVAASIGACGGQATVTFAAFSRTNLGNNTVTVSVPSDDGNSNNSLSQPMNSTTNDYSYKIPGSTAGGGVGLTGSVGAFLAEFTTTAADAITAVKLEFNAVTATMYRVAIYPDSGSGTPGTTPLYVDAADRTVTATGPVTITLPSPVNVGPGNFYVGLHQTNTTNANYSFDTENPVRSGTFYFTAALPPVTWTDFAPGTNFKLNIGAVLQTGCPSTPTCTGDIAPRGGNGVVNIDDLFAVINAWGACPVPPAKCPADIAPAGGNGTVNIDDLFGVINAWGPCP